MFKNPHLENQNTLSAKVYEYYNNKKQDRNLVQASEDGYVFHHFGFGPTMIDPSKATEEEITKEIQRQENEMASRLIELLGYTEEESRTLDIACGRGGNLLRIVDQYPNVKIDGVNIAHYQVDFCNDAIKERGVEDRAKVKQASYLNMPYPNETFTHEFCCEGTPYALDLKDLFREVERTLKPGGKFVIATWCYNHTKSENDLVNVIEPINDHYASTMHSDKFYKDSLSACGLTLIDEEDRSMDLIPYWELRDVWTMKSGIEENFLKGHKEGLILYKFFVAIK